jgi:ATP-dependent 26S proteasome regulatory subunit
MDPEHCLKDLTYLSFQRLQQGERQLSFTSSYIQAMEVDTRPTEQYSDIGGLDKQIQELVEAVVLPMTHKDRFVNLGIKPPKAGLQKNPG